jgi:hypothetical protein
MYSRAAAHKGKPPIWCYVLHKWTDPKTGELKKVEPKHELQLAQYNRLWTFVQSA